MVSVRISMLLSFSSSPLRAWELKSAPVERGGRRHGLQNNFNLTSVFVFICDACYSTGSLSVTDVIVIANQIAV